MHFTWLDSNSWLLEMGNQHILVDPWLEGSLIFGNLPWLFKGDRPHPVPMPEHIDLILLSQGLEDHAHPQTLERLARSLPVVASSNGAKVVQAKGYTQVTALAHGERFSLNSSVDIQAIPGSPIGPTLVENAYLLTERATGYTVYYEPHGFHSPTLQDLAPVDVVITPIVDLALPLLGPVIQGQTSALKVAQWLHPQVMLPTANAGEVTYEGLLAALLQVRGSVHEFRTTLTQANLATQVIEPKPGDRFELPLQPRSSLTLPTR